MIPRYEQKDVSKIWSDKAKFGFYLQSEVALLKALEEHGILKEKVSHHFEKAEIRPERIDEIEQVTRHDIIAFCTSITEQFPQEVSKFFHFGCTSSDIIDTSLSLQMKASLEIILNEYKETLIKLKNLADKYKDLPCVGRSHGMFAEPMSFGQKFLLAYVEFKRRYQELSDFFENEITGQFSGAVGNYTILSPEVEEAALKHLGLKTEPVSTQVISRDHLAKLASIIGLYSGCLERFCVEIRHLHHSDLGELQEGFSKGQKGSSTMPQKKNPIASENLSGIARTLRSYQTMAIENMVLWHERDISHSSSERLYLPDMFGLMVYSLRRLNSMLDRLDINEEVVKGKAEGKFTTLASYYLHQLLPEYKGTREELYAEIQKISFNSKTMEEFYQAVKSLADANSIPLKEEIPSITSIYLKHVDEVYKRV